MWGWWVNINKEWKPQTAVTTTKWLKNEVRKRESKTQVRRQRKAKANRGKATFAFVRKFCLLASSDVWRQRKKLKKIYIEGKGEPKDLKDRKKAHFCLCHCWFSRSSWNLQRRDNLGTSEQFVNVNNDESSGRRRRRKKADQSEGRRKEGRKRYKQRRWRGDCWATDKETVQDSVRKGRSELAPLSVTESEKLATQK